MPGWIRSGWVGRRGLATMAAMAAVALTVVGCGNSSSPGPSSEPSAPGPSPTSTASGPIPLILDNDMSLDDLMAMAYLTARSDVELLGVTVTGTGIAHCGPGARNARNLLHELGAPEVPTACGSEEPVGSGKVFPEGWREGADGLFGLTVDGVPGTPKGTAIELLGELIGGSEQPVTILATGPLTNLAEALAADPALAEGIERIVIMGGAVDVDGNATEDAGAAPAEWNFAADPSAAAAVFAAGIPITLVPLDATNDVPITRAFADELHSDTTAGPANLVDELLLRYSFAIDVDYFWDVLAAVLLVEPEVVTTEEARVAVTVDGIEAGRTVRADDGAPVTLATAADRQAFEAAFLEALRAGGPRLSPFEVPGIIDVSFDGSTCSVDMPAAVAAGTWSLAFVNDSSVEAVAVVAGLTEGSTWDDFDAWVEEHPGTIGQPPMIIVEGITFLGPEAQGSALAEITPGDRSIVCLIATSGQEEVISGPRFVVE